MSALKSLLSALSDTKQALLIIVACFTMGGASGAYLVSYRNLPKAVEDLSHVVEENNAFMRQQVTILTAQQHEAEEERSELRCLVLANYRGSGIDACLSD